MEQTQAQPVTVELEGAPEQEGSGFPHWIKLLFFAILGLVVIIVLVSIFLPKCKKGDDSLLCGIDKIVNGIGTAIQSIAKNIWDFIIAGIAALLLLFGIKWGPKKKPSE